MLSEAPSNPKDPWETPPLELDSELIETSQRLMSLSKERYRDPLDLLNTDVQAQTPDPRMRALETRNKFLFNRNIELSAKVAALEAANLRLQEQVSDLKQSQRSTIPWYRRWFQSK
jgi:hypothetical protein